MAERSFLREVEQLKVPAGTEFRGEGILAVTKALLEAGVGYVTGYQGSPISHLMDVLADAQPILNELGVYFEPAASEAAAAAALSASVNYPVRGAVTWKSTVGTNVASDALSNQFFSNNLAASRAAPWSLASTMAWAYSCNLAAPPRNDSWLRRMNLFV